MLIIGADWFLDGAGDLGRALGVSALVLGALLAGLEPEEMLTAAVASVRGAPLLAVGNVIGTNVTITTAALGLSALIFPLAIDRRVRRQALLATLVSVLPVSALLRCGHTIGGISPSVVFVGYTIFLFRTDREAMKRLVDDDDDEGEQEKQARLGSALETNPADRGWPGIHGGRRSDHRRSDSSSRRTHWDWSGSRRGNHRLAGNRAEMIALGKSAASQETI